MTRRPLRAAYTHGTLITGGDALATRTKLIAILALPAGLIGYVVTAAVLSGLGAPDVLVLLVPVFVAGLCMAPFLLPLFDQMAKRDLAAYRQQQGRSATESDAESAAADGDDRVD